MKKLNSTTAIVIALAGGFFANPAATAAQVPTSSVQAGAYSYAREGVKVLAELKGYEGELKGFAADLAQLNKELAELETSRNAILESINAVNHQRSRLIASGQDVEQYTAFDKYGNKAIIRTTKSGELNRQDIALIHHEKRLDEVNRHIDDVNARINEAHDSYRAFLRLAMCDCTADFAKMRIANTGTMANRMGAAGDERFAQAIEQWLNEGNTEALDSYVDNLVDQATLTAFADDLAKMDREMVVLQGRRKAIEGSIGAVNRQRDKLVASGRDVEQYTAFDKHGNKAIIRTTKSGEMNRQDIALIHHGKRLEEVNGEIADLNTRMGETSKALYRAIDKN